MLCVSSAILVLLSIIASPALAQAQNSSASDAWKFTAAPYVILPWMDGEATLRGNEVPVDVGAGQIFDALQFAAMGYFEARKGRWAAGVDAVYMALGISLDRPSANVDFNQGAYTFIGMRQLNEKVDFVFGARWNVLQGKLAFKGPLETTIEDTKHWVDPIVGLKLKHRLGGRLTFTMEGDIGGFGAGSDFSWQLFPVVGIDLNKRATLAMGYRALSNDYHTGSGDQSFEYDVVTQGMVLGAMFHF